MLKNWLLAQNSQQVNFKGGNFHGWDSTNICGYKFEDHNYSIQAAMYVCFYKTLITDSMKCVEWTYGFYYGNMGI